MSNINSVNISGNLGADPELRLTPGGADVLSFSVCVNTRVPDGAGGWTDKPNWVRVVVFGKRATGLSKVLAKGMKVAVSGSLDVHVWEKDDEKRRSVSVIASSIDIMTRQKEPEGAEAYTDGIPF